MGSTSSGTGRPPRPGSKRRLRAKRPAYLKVPSSARFKTTETVKAAFAERPRACRAAIQRPQK